MAKDWDAVAAAIQTRLDELGMTQQELAHRAGVALMTVRELQHNLKPRRRNPRTLAAISEALGLSDSHLSDVLAGKTPREPAAEASDPVLSDLEALKQQLTAITERLDAIERRLADDDERG
ncbi:hypothetical protein DFQ14_10394 [Halopolyspora algeriensis]|uniref:HTH cro/C1-type domain-containing protein n=1 Tax=Halopolyspora algeriensis TaxID=1500506 RepID=A0A368VT23_9ACTN|nr:helix-turn-helix transcriptional regulator [Halopolyspora algeriensis]RCW45130.1 hypothetical protein DFQ14_10394 [Halopolyspora algeriensis]TQM53148.1 hypothetical protein FHU43_2530 [Halopolyspora algeriensis]